MFIIRNKQLDHPKRIKQYEKYINDPIFARYKYPMSLRDIRTFEKKSFSKFEGYASISIDVFTFDPHGIIVPIQISVIYDAELEVDLLFYKKGDNSHYIYITDLDKLVASQLSNHETKKYLCRRCLSHFYNNEDLYSHQEICKSHEPVKPIMPKISETAYFKNYYKKIEQPYVIYTNF